MAKFIKQSEIVETITYTREYRYKDMPSAGFTFDCDRHGNVETSEFSAVGLANYTKCSEGKDPNLVYEGVQSHEHRYRTAAVVACEHCQRHVELHQWTNKCDCGAFYNGAGQRLSHPRNWGSETGERFDDDGNQIL